MRNHREFLITDFSLQGWALAGTITSPCYTITKCKTCPHFPPPPQTLPPNVKFALLEDPKDKNGYSSLKCSKLRQTEVSLPYVSEIFHFSSCRVFRATLGHRQIIMAVTDLRASLEKIPWAFAFRGQTVHCNTLKDLYIHS